MTPKATSKVHRKIVGKHLLRWRARADQHRLERLQAAVYAPPGEVLVTPAQRAEWDEMAISRLSKFTIERAGRIRARWQVVASW